jgi:hypothetical protein
VNDDARIIERGDGAVAQIAGALRSAARKNHHVARGKPLMDEARQHDLVVGSDAERLRAPAGFLDGSGEDCSVRIVDRAGADRVARRDNLVAGRDNGYLRPPPDFDSGATDRRQHANLARGQYLSRAQHGFAARQVAAGKGDELPGCRSPSHLDHRGAVVIPRFGVLDHDDGVGPARHHPAGRNQRRGIGCNSQLRHCAGGEDLSV